MAAVRPVPFPVFVSAGPRFSEVEPSWSFACDSGGDLVAVGANYNDGAGVALKIESIAPQTPIPSRISRQPIAFAVARAGSRGATGRRELGEVMQHAREAKHGAGELALEIDLDGRRLVPSGLSYEEYFAGTVEIEGQRVTVSGHSLEVPVKLRRRRTPLPAETPDNMQR